MVRITNLDEKSRIRICFGLSKVSSALMQYWHRRTEVKHEDEPCIKCAISLISNAYHVKRG
jgi:hypothetical protein